MTDVARFAARAAAVAGATKSNFLPDELSHEFGEAVIASFCPTIFDKYCPVLDPAEELAQLLPQRLDPMAPR